MHGPRVLPLSVLLLCSTSIAQNYFHAQPTGGDGGEWTQQTAKYYSPERRCKCYDCDGLGIAESARFCRGLSEGCSVDSGEGCFGENDAGVGGDCDCRSGRFSNPEVNEIGGIVTGLNPDQQLTVAASWIGDGTHTSDATQAISIVNDGQFIFPLKLKKGQNFEMAVTKDPENQKCTIDNPKGQTDRPQTLVHVSCISTGPIQIGTTGCTCVQCNGGGTAPNDAFCSGRSIGCTVSSDENKGCFGVNHNYVTGRCDCSSHSFSAPELYQISGHLFGLFPGQILELGCESASLHAHSNGVDELSPHHKPAVQSITLDRNGQFVFPYRLTKAQRYKITVVDQPTEQQCMVNAAAEGAAGNGIVTTITVTCNAKTEAGTRDVSYEGAEQARDREYSSRIIPIASNQQAGGGFLMFVFLAAGGYWAHQNGMLAPFLGGDSVRPYTPIGEGSSTSGGYQG